MRSYRGLEMVAIAVTGALLAGTLSPTQADEVLSTWEL